MQLKLVVIIASVGRPGTLRQTVANLARQTRLPDAIVVVAAGADDVGGVEPAAAVPLDIIFTERGLPIQRNAGLRHIGAGADVVTFFDDDFVPAPDYLETAEKLFDSSPCLVGATGRLIADGVNGPGLSFETAAELVARDVPPRHLRERLMLALYGCNFSIRVRSARGLWFDEGLPLYGWQEDVDFTYRLGKRGLLLRTEQLAGVHMGIKAGRTSGKRLGYSQIANPLYLLQKESMPPRLAWRLMLRNLSANMVRAFAPEPHVDRRGRLNGNFIALADLALGKLDPRRIMAL